MAQMNLPAAPNYKRTSYSGLLGCDFSVDPSLVDRRRSPDCLNMISDNGGNPVKRKGWEVVKSTSENRIENIWSFKPKNWDRRVIVYTRTYVGDNDVEVSQLECIDSTDTTGTVLASATTTPGKHCAFYTNISTQQNGLYVLDGERIYRVHTVRDSVEIQTITPYIPLILISRTPTGGGYVYEDINLLTKRRKEDFRNTQDNKSFVVSSSVDTSKPYSLHYKNGSGNWIEDQNITVSGATFTTTEAHNPPSSLGQADNIRIIYYAATTSSSPDKSGEIYGCTACAHFSHTAQDQIFLTGNPDQPNNVYYSAPNNIAYFPDLNYLSIGGDNQIMGFLNLGEYLAVVKGGTSEDSTIFLIYQTSIASKTVSSDDGSTTTTQERTFAIKRSTAGIGAVSRYAFGVLNDEPLFMSQYGVYGVVPANFTSEKMVRNRSFMVDQKLVKEDLKNSVATVWNNYYVIAAGGDETKQDYVRDDNGDIVYENVTKTYEDDYTGETYEYSVSEPKMQTVSAGRMYLLDGRHKTSNSSGNTNYGYECYYWEGIPASCVTSYDKELWFGTYDGNVCRFKNSGQDSDYTDNTYVVDSTIKGLPIVARWSTPNDNDGMTEYFKTMMKKGTMCTVAPYKTSSVKAYISVDGYPREYIGKLFYADITTLFNGEIDFGTLSFDASIAPKDRFFRKKKKKYKRLQIILENDAPNQPFGVFEIVKTYIYQRYAK